MQAGVIRDANPAGYGADRLDAQAGRALTALELLERGVPDGVGAIEVCTDIETKLAWQPKALVWARDHEDLPGQLQEVWRRMAFNALVGNGGPGCETRRSWWLATGSRCSEMRCGR